MAALVPNGGPKSCNYGCLGFGSCVKVCSNNAISIVNGVAVVDKIFVLPAASVLRHVLRILLN